MNLAIYRNPFLNLYEIRTRGGGWLVVSCQLLDMKLSLRTKNQQLITEAERLLLLDLVAEPNHQTMDG